MVSKEKVIYLEVDEEITSVVDRLRKIEAEEVFLVIPKRANIIQSLVNLKLLKKQIDNLGKKVVIVTGDRIGRNLAAQVGFPVAQKLSEKPVQIEIPKRPEEGPLFVSYKKEEKALGVSSVSDIRYKPVEPPTKEVKLSSQEVPQKKLASPSMPLPQPGISSKVEKPEEPKPTYDFKKALPSLPKINRRLLVLFLVLGLLALFSTFVLILPRAKITIYPEVEEVRNELNVSLSSAFREVDYDSLIIPAELVSVEKEEIRKFPSTGKKDIGTKASGVIRILNTSGASYNWVAGTRFAPHSNSSLIFRANNQVVIGPWSTVEVGITAENPGEQYNLPAGTQFYVVALGSLPNLTMVSLEGTSGGLAKVVNVVSSQDVEGAKNTLASSLFEAAQNELEGQLAGKTYLKQAIIKDFLETTANPSVGAEASDFELKVKVKVWTLVYQEENMNLLLNKKFEASVPPDKQLIFDKTKFDFEVLSSDLGTGLINLKAKLVGYLAARFNVEDLKNHLVFKNKKEASRYLKSQEGVKEVIIETFPRWWPKLPLSKSKITLELAI